MGSDNAFEGTEPQTNGSTTDAATNSPAQDPLEATQPVEGVGLNFAEPLTAADVAALKAGGVELTPIDTAQHPELAKIEARANELLGEGKSPAEIGDALRKEFTPASAPVALTGNVDYTLTSADAAKINCHLEGDYVKEDMPVNASRDAEGNLFVQVYEAKVLLGVES